VIEKAEVEAEEKHQGMVEAEGVEVIEEKYPGAAEAEENYLGVTEAAKAKKRRDSRAWQRRQRRRERRYNRMYQKRQRQR